jgi:hypothetical protein
VTDPVDGQLDAVTLAELRRLARSRPKSGRGAMAKAAAIGTLERLGRGRRQIPPCPPGWHAGLPEFEELDAGDDPATRARWWANLHK